VTERQVPTIDIGPNEVLRFVIEMVALVGIGWGTAVLVNVPVLGVFAGIAAAALAAVVWGLFRSPRARFPLPWPGRAAVEVLVLGTGVAGWALAGFPIPAMVGAIVAVVSGIINLIREEKRS
jgi:hypothetical protein